MPVLALPSILPKNNSNFFLMGLSNPVQMIRKPKIDNARDRRLGTEKEKYLLEALSASGKGQRANSWVGPICILSLETGMRQSDELAIDWKDVDLVDRFLRLRDFKKDEGRGVPLSRRAVKLLQALPTSISGKVFPTTARALKQSWRRAVERAKRNYLDDCEKAGKKPAKDFLEDFHFHDLRHEQPQGSSNRVTAM